MTQLITRTQDGPRADWTEHPFGDLSYRTSDGLLDLPPRISEDTLVYVGVDEYVSTGSSVPTGLRIDELVGYCRIVEDTRSTQNVALAILDDDGTELFRMYSIYRTTDEPTFKRVRPATWFVEGWFEFRGRTLWGQLRIV